MPDPTVPPFEPIAELAVEPATARIYEHGWQSWGPSTTYGLADSPARAASANAHVMGYRQDRRPPPGAFQGEGVLAVQPATGAPVHVFASLQPDADVPSIIAKPRRSGITVSATGPVVHHIDDGPGGIQGALARWADDYAHISDVGPIRQPPTGWCSWYHYFARVSERDIDENLAEIARLDLPIEVVQLDDGYESEIGDWLTLSDQFGSLDGVVSRIRAAGRRAGIWIAPFLVGARSETARRHSEWLVGGPDGPVDAGHNWGQDLYVLDTTHPGALEYIIDAFTTFRAKGIDYFKIDFVYAGALEGQRWEAVGGIAAYRAGLDAIRRAVGDDAYIVGCGAPILPSVGRVDAMRISPDTSPTWRPEDDDISRPSGLASVITGTGRAFQHGRFWVNDPDCLMARPGIEHREELAAHIERFGGLRASSDRLADLDDWGLATTRRILSKPAPALFIDS